MLVMLRSLTVEFTVDKRLRLKVVSPSETFIHTRRGQLQYISCFFVFFNYTYLCKSQQLGITYRLISLTIV